ncbi:MAG TPA: phage tail tape measure protein, partial [Candidatus Binataceae bacterium]|nr:phage tail tape measure protein [Candidatus Binataceae bacterium]
MALQKLLDFALQIKAVGFQGAAAAVQGLNKNIENMNKSVRDTAHLREAAGTMAGIGAVALGMGGAIAYGLKSTLDPAIEMQGEMAHVATAMDDGAKTQQHLAEVQKFANSIASKSAVTNVQLAESYYIARSNMLGHAEALGAVKAANDLVTATTRDAADAQAQMVETTRTLTTLMHNFGGTAQYYADMLAKLQTKYAFGNIGEITGALQYAMPTMKQAGVTATDASTALALLSSGGLHGQEAGTAFQELLGKLTTDTKLLPFLAKTAQGGTDLGATIRNLNAAFGGLTATQQSLRLKQLGFGERDIRGVALLIDKSKEYSATLKDMQNAQGSAAALAEKRRAASDYQWAIALNNINLFREAIGTVLLPAFTSLSSHLASAARFAAEFAENHPELVKIAVTAAAISSAVLIIGGGLALASGALLGFVSFLPALKTFATATRLGTVATKAWTAAQWLFNAAMDANPIGLVIAGAVALAVAAYEIYEHWSAVKGFFSGLWSDIKSIFTSFNTWTGGWAATLGKAVLIGITGPFGLIAIEIYKHWDAIKKACEHIASGIGKFFIGHSPPPVGPLHNLNKVNLIGTVADTIKPAPAIAAVRRAAAAIAVTMPLMLTPLGASAAQGPPRA